MKAQRTIAGTQTTSTKLTRRDRATVSNQWLLVLQIHTGPAAELGMLGVTKRLLITNTPVVEVILRKEQIIAA